MTAANQFIHTQDLYELLLTHFIPPITTYVEPHTLAQLARTCKATSDLALDTLWRTLIIPSYILRLLPVDAWELVDTEYILVRPLVESDFEVFDKYAPRIRVVDFSSPSRSMGCDLFSSLKAFRDPIFPGLLEFRWQPSVNTIGAFQLISRGLPANTFSLSFWEGNLTSSPRPRENVHPANPREVAALLNQPLSAWFPDVQSLNLAIGTKYRAISDVLEGLQSLTRLEDLTVNFSVGPNILAHLAQLPHLLSLHLFEEDERCISAAKQILDERSLQTGGSSLRALEKLSIHTCEYDALCALLALVTSPALHTVNFDLNGFHPTDATLFRLITGPDPTNSFARRASLRHIEFRVINSVGADRGGLPLLSDLFDPLFTCPNLTTLVVNTGVFLNDADVERMASSWPRLQRLSIYNRAREPAVHIATLPILASRCPPSSGN
ncbi:Carboxylic ester hydrolase [Mycena venus]|uniref:Carboxylic ester hydrolase n=1 Tax=Mycena venus TaxID=2733690 RepID=A0A8H6X5M1_9AGAR|nr:Carboxylic ester hydrolase [Mycena venus]